MTRLNNWTDAAYKFKEVINRTLSGIQLHKYKVSGSTMFESFASHHRLKEIGFLKNIIHHKDLQDYRIDLEISDKPEIELIKVSNDIFDLPGRLARIMTYGGAYKNTNPKLAWTIATAFTEQEFENRFDEFYFFEIKIHNAKWFCDVAWDHSILLFDKKNYELIFIDITDTD